MKYFLVTWKIIFDFGMTPFKKNPNSILLIYEGYTEEEFYYKIFSLQLPKRKIRVSYYNLKGIYSINLKVRAKLKDFLSDKSKLDQQNIHVLIAHDREGSRETESPLNLELIRDEFSKTKKSRIKSIEEIIATQDLESWFFHDINGIYNFLDVPLNLRNPHKYIETERFNNYNLSSLFLKFGKVYSKRGKSVEGFLDSLDLNLIFDKTPDLKLPFKKLCKL